MKMQRFIQSINSIIATVTSPNRLKAVLHKPLYANALHLLINYVVTEAIGFVFWMVATRIYTAENVGLGSAAISATQLLAMISLLGMNMALVRFLTDAGEKANELINSCLTIGGFAAMIAGVVFLLGVGVWSPALILILQNGIYFAAFVIFSMATTVLSMFNHIFIADRRSGFVTIQNTIASMLKVGLVIILFLFGDSFGVFNASGIAILISILIGYFVLLPKIRPGYHASFVIRKDIVKKIFNFSLLNYFSNLLWETPRLILPIMVLNLLSAEQNAYFYIAWALAGILRAIPMAVSLSLFAEGSYDAKLLNATIWRSLKIILILLLPAVALMLAMGDKLLLLFGRSYSQYGTNLLWLMAIAALPVAVNYMYIAVKRIEKRLKGVLLLTTFVAIVTLGLSWVLLPQMGLPGAGVAWLIAQGIAAVVIVINWISKRTQTS